MRKIQKLTLNQVNSLLICLIIAVNLYTIGAPLQPAIGFWLRQHFTGTAKRLDNLVNNPASSNGSVPVPDGKRLVIPSILLDKPIYDNPNPLTVHRGVWLIPGTSTPDKGSNTVMAGHRFSYKDPAVFYNLDKMEIGQRFAVFWNAHKYLYEVDGKKEVPPTQTDIEAPTVEPRLTLYTCTPLITAKNRLVITAKLIETSQ
jgi:sortase A